MKKAICAVLLAAFCALSAGCSDPDNQTLDLSRGYGDHLKLIHLNASSPEWEERMAGFAQVLENADPLDKEFSLFAYYPDYLLELTENGETVQAVVDINGDYVDFYYPGESLDDPQPLYRSRVSAKEFQSLVNQV